jgi:hypothetical protein
MDDGSGSLGGGRRVGPNSIHETIVRHAILVGGILSDLAGSERSTDKVE